MDARSHLDPPAPGPPPSETSRRPRFLAIAILNNGLKRITAYDIFDRPISSVSNEMSGMLTGLLLLVALAAVPVVKAITARRRPPGSAEPPARRTVPH